MKAILAIIVSLLFILPTAAKDKKPKPGGIKVRLSKTIDRDYKKVVKDKFAYGPKQEYDRKTKTTHIWLPYGNNPELYYEVKGILTDPSEENKQAKFRCSGGHPGSLTYKIEFDRAITEFTFAMTWFEYGLTKGTECGVEYSVNGRNWKTMKKVEGKEENDKHAVKQFIKDAKIEGLNTKVLYIKIYSKSNKKAITQGGQWIHFWMTGNPNWGDIQKTFFIHQPQIWVKRK